ncbi:hypothetical protein [Desulfatiglans anilini]|uniref:hypothetical protein n=1 Tax=Desulfatiglans anilini TaxID=90728 RepID=UPI00041A44A5|nr:hypothetical protein [Desulfatiglans anilini]
MPLEKVDLGGDRRKVEVTELPGYNVLVPKQVKKRFLKSFKIYDELSELGIQKRLDLKDPLWSEKVTGIMNWLWSHGLTLVQRFTAPDKSGVQFFGQPIMFHKFNMGQGDEWITRPGLLSEDPDVKPLIGKRHPVETTPSTFMQWSGDVNYPFNFAHFETALEACMAFAESFERGWVYPLPSNNMIFTANYNFPRLGTLIGTNDCNIPGVYVRDKHRKVQEKPKKVQYLFTPKEEKWYEEHGRQWSAAKEVGLDIDSLLEDLKAGKLDEHLTKPGKRTWFESEIPHYHRIQKGMGYWRKKKMLGEADWYKELNRCGADGEMIGFGEFEAEEWRAQIKKMGFTEIDENAIFNAKSQPFHRPTRAFMDEKPDQEEPFEIQHLPGGEPTLS